MSFVYGHTLWSTIQTTGGDSSPVLCIASPFRWFLQCFPAQHSFWPSILIFPFSCNGENAAFCTVKRLCLTDKRTFSTTLKFYSSMDVHSIFLFHLTEDKSTGEVSSSILSTPYIGITAKAPQSSSLISLIFFCYECDIWLSLTFYAQFEITPRTLYL